MFHVAVHPASKGKDRNSLACLRNAGSYFEVTYSCSINRSRSRSSQLQQQLQLLQCPSGTWKLADRNRAGFSRRKYVSFAMKWYKVPTKDTYFALKHAGWVKTVVSMCRTGFLLLLLPTYLPTLVNTITRSLCAKIHLRDFTHIQYVELTQRLLGPPLTRRRWRRGTEFATLKSRH